MTSRPEAYPRLWALLLLAAGGCSFAPEPEVPQTVQRVPDAYEESTSPRDSTWSAVHWWRAYDDPTLDRLVDTVLAANLDLVEAVGRVEESRALAGVALADLLPSLSGSADANYSSSPANAGFGQIIGGGEEGDSTASFRPDRFETTDYPRRRRPPPSWDPGRTDSGASPRTAGSGPRPDPTVARKP